MPDVRVVGATIGDVHARHTPPRCRAEKDWYGVMADHFAQVQKILRDHGDPPLFVAGDLFDKWSSPPELINFMLRHFPRCWAVPGNHDLPYHNYGERKRSAYWTLVEAGKVQTLRPGVVTGFDSFCVTGFPFGHEPKDWESPGHLINDRRKRFALIHDYCWADGHSHPGAPEDKHVQQWGDRLRGYDALIFGDNHQPFSFPKKEWKSDCLPAVRNGGCFMRQSIVEMDCRPSVGLLMSDGSIKDVCLDRRSDRFNLDPDPAGDVDGFADVVEEMLALERTHVDFPAAVRRAVRKLSPAARRLALEYLGEETRG